jgi:hypothetical protein
LDSSYGLKPAADFRLTTKATNAVPVKAFSDRQSSISLSNLVESAHQVRSRRILSRYSSDEKLT